MMTACNGMIFVLLFVGTLYGVSWLWDAGIREILIYTEHFLIKEAKRVRVQVLPEINSTKPWDKLELMLFYSGIRNYFPFISGKVWIVFCMMLLCCGFLITMFSGAGILWAVLVCTALLAAMMQLPRAMRRHNLKNTERSLLELLNVTESFAATGEEPVAILRQCSVYLKGPVGHALRSIEGQVGQGWSSRMILEQLKVKLEHPKWQEFIHNLNVCSMYNSDFGAVFRTSRKSIQSYLTSKKERQGIKHTAEMEMAAIVALSFLMILILGKFLMMPAEELLWGSIISRVCTVYMVGVVMLFYMKVSAYEKE